MRTFLKPSILFAALFYGMISLLFHTAIFADKRPEHTSADHFGTFSYINDHRDELDISQEQSEELLSMSKSFQKDMRELSDRLKALETELETLSWETPYDLQNIDIIVENKRDLLEKEQELSEKTSSRISNLLTEQQKEKLKNKGIINAE
jgi:Spy/CpxP family protein refolding chaperone